MDKELLDILVCPQDRTPLSLADERTLAELNRAIDAGQIENQGGQPVRERLHCGLVRQDGFVLYPVVDEIPVLLIEEGIALDQIRQG